MSKVTNIGSRIHSVERGNVVAGANEILDDAKGKKQNVINSETGAELLRLDQSKQNNLTFDNTPTENSNNPVKSSGVYAADKVLSDAIEAILVLIPSAASALNQLADKAFVNSSVSTATATFRGTYNVVTDLELAYDATHEQIATKLGQVIAMADNNDYAFVQVPVSATSTDIRRTERYKFNGTAWGYEYDLNTSGFTAAQWEAINSGITALLVSKLTNLPTAEVLATMFNAKQNVLTFDAAPTALSTNPVYSGGVYAAIKAITDLIPEEAATTNHLADKAYVLAQILAATPAFKGQFETLVELLAVESPKAGDLGIVRTKDSDGYDVFTFYQYSAQGAWVVYYTLHHYAQNKPATTGTKGDYPYNGMGRVVIPKKMVKDVNTLTHEAFEDSEGNDRENIIYVIQYDFTLGEDINVPANCVLEFDGGSISGDGTGKDTITGNNTGIQAGLVKIFNIDVTLAGSWTVAEAYSEWFGAKGDGIADDRLPFQKTIEFCELVQCKMVVNNPDVYYLLDSMETEANVGTYCLKISKPIVIEGRTGIEHFDSNSKCTFRLGDFDSSVDYTLLLMGYTEGSRRVLNDVSINRVSFHSVNKSGTAHVATNVIGTDSGMYAINLKLRNIAIVGGSVGFNLCTYWAEIDSCITMFSGTGYIIKGLGLESSIVDCTSVTLNKCSFIHSPSSQVQSIGIYIKNMLYTSLINCGVDAAKLAYKIENCKGVSFINSACEKCVKAIDANVWEGSNINGFVFIPLPDQDRTVHIFDFKSVTGLTINGINISGQRPYNPIIMDGNCDNNFIFDQKMASNEISLSGTIYNSIPYILNGAIPFDYYDKYSPTMSGSNVVSGSQFITNNFRHKTKIGTTWRNTPWSNGIFRIEKISISVTGTSTAGGVGTYSFTYTNTSNTVPMFIGGICSSTGKLNIIKIEGANMSEGHIRIQNLHATDDVDLSEETFVCVALWFD